MERNQFDRVMAVFEEILEVSPEDRTRRLRDICGEDVDLYHQVESLLEQADSDDGFLEADTPGAVIREHLVGLSSRDGEQKTDIKIPERIGPYKILGLLGRGGMGTVYEAQQDKPRRRIALKVLRASYLRDEIRTRFEQEAQILGRLRHSGIAHVYEAGLTSENDGEPLPYFAMELVEGLPLTAYARDRGLATRERLELMARICDAVEHAHGHGIIHRDLKPDNILVNERGEPKVLDFGVARIMNTELMAASLATLTGQLIGTLSYMSPEQVGARPDDVDVRSDVYALGVVAFELLAGELPLELSTVAIPEAVRRILEVDPPHLGSFNRKHRGDVATIIAKALEKEPHRRYASAADLSQDIRHFLADEPIIARPQSGLYQLRKFAHRNKAMVAGVLVAFLALLAGTMVATHQAVIARQERAHAITQRQLAQRQSYGARLAASAMALESHDSELARSNLDATPEALRGWEWSHLRSRLDQSSVAFETGTGRFTWIHFAADGRRLLILDRSTLPWFVLPVTLSEKVQLGERLLGGLSRPYRAPLEYRWPIIRILHFARGERQVALHEPSGESPLLLRRCGPSSVSASVLGLADDGRRAVVRSAPFGDSLERSMRLCDLQTGEGGPPFSVSTKVMIFALTGDGSLAAVAAKLEAAADRIHVISTMDGVTRMILGIPFDDVTAIDLSQDGQRLIAGSYNGVLRLWDVKTGELLAEKRSHGGSYIHAVRFSADGSRIASGSLDRTIRLWPLDLNAPVVLHGHADAVVEVRFSADATQLVSSDLGGMVRLWQIATDPTEPQVLRGHQSYVNPLRYSADGRLLVSGAWDGTIRLWDATTGEARDVIRPGQGSDEFGITSLVLNSDGSRLAAGTSRGDLFLYDLGTLRPLGRASLGSALYHLEFASEGMYLLAGTMYKELHVLDAGSLEEVGREPFGLPFAWSPDGERLLLRESETSLVVRQGLSGAIMARLDGVDAQTNTAAWSPDGDRIVTASRSGEVLQWDSVTGKRVGTLGTHTDPVHSVRFHPDGSRIATGGADGVIRLFHAGTGDELVQLRGHEGYVYALAWQPDGSTLASSSGDGTVRLWHTVRRTERTALREPSLSTDR